MYEQDVRHKFTVLLFIIQLRTLYLNLKKHNQNVFLFFDRRKTTTKITLSPEKHEFMMNKLFVIEHKFFAILKRTMAGSNK